MIDDTLPCYVPPDPSLWQGRTDSLPNERFFQHVQCIDMRYSSLESSKTSVLLGLASDEGIRRNQGRTGAQLGPNHLRTQLGKLACHTAQNFLDIGNIHCTDDDLETAQDAFASLVSHCHALGHKTIALGGGHEIAWGHFLGLAPHHAKLGIINFDAHFDLRPVYNDLGSTSGTPFWQIKTYADQQQRSFEYCCLGIQSVANTQSLFQQANAWHVPFLMAEQIHHTQQEHHIDFLNQFIQNQDAIYLTICLDVFSESVAPGVSAPQPNGLMPWQVLPLLKYIVQTGKVVGMDIAELSPPLDQEEKTSRLAAVILAELLNLKD